MSSLDFSEYSDMETRCPDVFMDSIIQCLTNQRLPKVKKKRTYQEEFIDHDDKEQEGFKRFKTKEMLLTRVKTVRRIFRIPSAPLFYHRRRVRETWRKVECDEGESDGKVASVGIYELEGFIFTTPPIRNVRPIKQNICRKTYKKVRKSISSTKKKVKFQFKRYKLRIDNAWEKRKEKKEEKERQRRKQRRKQIRKQQRRQRKRRSVKRDKNEHSKSCKVEKLLIILICLQVVTIGVC